MWVWDVNDRNVPSNNYDADRRGRTVLLLFLLYFSLHRTICFLLVVLNFFPPSVFSALATACDHLLGIQISKETLAEDFNSPAANEIDNHDASQPEFKLENSDETNTLESECEMNTLIPPFPLFATTYSTQA